MRTLLRIAAAAALIAGCASFEGRGLVPGQSTAADVDLAMGRAAEKRVQANGETWVYYPRQPYGLQTHVARFAPDGRFIALDQRLTDENVARLERGKSRSDDVRDLFGPPYTQMRIPRLGRDIWEYRMQHAGIPGVPHALYVQMSSDGIVREVYTVSDPDNRLSECCAR